MFRKTQLCFRNEKFYLVWDFFLLIRFPNSNVFLTVFGWFYVCVVLRRALVLNEIFFISVGFYFDG